MWPVYFGCWSTAIVTVHWQRLHRSILTAAIKAFYFMYVRGKQKLARQGFHWSVSLHVLSAGRPIAEHIKCVGQKFIAAGNPLSGRAARPTSGGPIKQAAATTDAQAFVNILVVEGDVRALCRLEDLLPIRHQFFSFPDFTPLIRSGLGTGWTEPGGAKQYVCQVLRRQVARCSWLLDQNGQELGKVSQRSAAGLWPHCLLRSVGLVIII